MGYRDSSPCQGWLQTTDPNWSNVYGFATTDFTQPDSSCLESAKTLVASLTCVTPIRLKAACTSLKLFMYSGSNRVWNLTRFICSDPETHRHINCVSFCAQNHSCLAVGSCSSRTTLVQEQLNDSVLLGRWTTFLVVFLRNTGTQ